jgi:hypothetical protein
MLNERNITVTHEQFAMLMRYHQMILTAAQTLHQEIESAAKHLHGMMQITADPTQTQPAPLQQFAPQPAQQFNPTASSGVQQFNPAQFAQQMAAPQQPHPMQTQPAPAQQFQPQQAPMQQFAPQTAPQAAPVQDVTSDMIMQLVTPLVGAPQGRELLQAAMQSVGVNTLPEAQPHQYAALYSAFKQVEAQLMGAAQQAQNQQFTQNGLQPGQLNGAAGYAPQPQSLV